MRKNLFTLACAALLAAPASAVTIDWVSVGDAGNAADSTTYGAVAYDYRISETEVTNDQYAELLNAADPTGANALGLYNTNMDSDASFGGISFAAGNAAGSKYVVKAGFASKPVNYVSVYDSLRFANWLHNGQGAGSTETGAYTLLGGTPIPSDQFPTRNAGATIFLTGEDEWYKAAYYDAGTLSYNPYPFADGFNGVACELPAGTTSHSANCDSVVGALTDGGAYAGSPSEYGTFDQGGNVAEWTEAIFFGSYVFRGSSLGGDPSDLAASARGFVPGSIELPGIGFRVASLPEPGSGLLLIMGMLGLAAHRRWAA